MYALKINFEQKGLDPVVLENVKAGESLLEVILDAGIELHHNCGAVCACSTCHPRIESRLGCQCVIQEGNGEIEVTLPDQTQFLGE